MINSYYKKQALYVKTPSKKKKKKIANVHKGYGMTLYNITTALPTTRLPQCSQLQSDIPLVW